MDHLAITYQYQGRREEAEDLEVEVMQTRKKMLGIEHSDTLASISIFASKYLNQGRVKETEKLEVQTLEVYRRVLGLEHTDKLISTANLA